jgi:hypothetical protein
VREIPILFSAPMVRAILDGRKTVTRRAVKSQPAIPGICAYTAAGFPEDWMWSTESETIGRPFRCPYGTPGDRLCVRETWRAPDYFDGIAPRVMDAAKTPVWYDATPGVVAFPRALGITDAQPGKTRVSIHMPRWASRLTLEVVSVRVERLHDIDEADANPWVWRVEFRRLEVPHG